MIQTELEEAGFELLALKKRLLLANNSDANADDARLEQLLQEEVQRWTHNYIDVNGLVRKLLNAERANKKLREELAQLLSEKSRQSNKKVDNNFTGNTSCSCCSCDDDGETTDAFESNDNLTTSVKTSLKTSLKSPTESDESFDIGVVIGGVGGKTKVSSIDNSITTFYDEVNFDAELDDDDVIGEQHREPQHCSLVTVLASDGYTCVTSPLIDSNQMNKNHASTASIRIVASDHFGADSGEFLGHSQKVDCGLGGLSIIYKYKTSIGLIKGVKSRFVLIINDINHNPPLPTSRVQHFLNGPIEQAIRWLKTSTTLY